MSLWEVMYWADVEVWLDSLSREHFSSIAKEIMLLEQCGNELRLPHSKSLGNGLFELREKRFGCRMYYTFLPNKKVMLLEAGDKKSQKRDIQTARLRLSKV